MSTNHIQYLLSLLFAVGCIPTALLQTVDDDTVTLYHVSDSFVGAFNHTTDIGFIHEPEPLSPVLLEVN